MQGRRGGHDQHLLSMKDNNQSANLRALIDAGISSFKIEGRLKDLAYVKNITAHYRTLIDDIIAAQARHSAAPRAAAAPSSSRRSRRRPSTAAATDYFANGRQHGIEAFESPGFVGEDRRRSPKIGANGPGSRSIPSSRYPQRRRPLFLRRQGRTGLRGVRINRRRGARICSRRPDAGGSEPG
jgi:hypothetical protein